ncbi:unnamed protein product [Somion occarium]|uniref:Uncharacterized protein n=1 Tax=Somion occarium TaxID=3059160 RepID=A0ABP1DVJ8_9APHY
MASSRHFSDMNFSSAYPDNNSTKELFLQAGGRKASDVPRHVLLFWWNNQSSNMREIVQLKGISGRYTYDHRVQMSSPTSEMNNERWSLGMATRAARNRIIEIAAAVPFNPRSTVNDCRVWMRLLLEAMVQEHIITQEKFDEIDRVQIPLPRPAPEV